MGLVTSFKYPTRIPSPYLLVVQSLAAFYMPPSSPWKILGRIPGELHSCPENVESVNQFGIPKALESIQELPFWKQSHIPPKRKRMSSSFSATFKEDLLLFPGGYVAFFRKKIDDIIDDEERSPSFFFAKVSFLKSDALIRFAPEKPAVHLLVLFFFPWVDYEIVFMYQSASICNYIEPIDV